MQLFTSSEGVWDASGRNAPEVLIAQAFENVGEIVVIRARELDDCCWVLLMHYKKTVKTMVINHQFESVIGDLPWRRGSSPAAGGRKSCRSGF